MIKSFWQSKAFWLGVLTLLVSIIEYLAGLPVGATIATAVVGVLQIIIRFYTNSAIASTPGAKSLKK